MQQLGQKCSLLARVISFRLPLEMSLNDTLRKAIHNGTMRFNFIRPELEERPLPAQKRSSGGLRDRCKERICKAIGGMLQVDLVCSVLLNAVVRVGEPCIEGVYVLVQKVDCRRIQCEPCCELLDRDA